MDKIKIRVNGIEKECRIGDTAATVVGNNATLPYEENPTVGVLVNGVLSGLDKRIKGPCDIDEVRLFSTFGKRIYRKTICLLLSYASTLLYPDRVLVIGHSLGDGYYFHYRDDEPFDAGALDRKMREIAASASPIEYATLNHEDAVEDAKKRHRVETLALLESMNDNEYKFVKIGDYYQLFNEPVLTDTHLCTLFEVREYNGGILLRYPQGRSITSIRPFEDNPQVFSIFKESRRNAENLGLQSLGELNRRQLDGSLENTILLLEAQQRRKIVKISEMIAARPDVKIVFIAGPSSSGKTTFSMKLSDELRVMGKKAIKISIDDYYLPREETPKDENGEYDFEVLEALNLDLFREQMKDLTEGRGVHLPSFSFIEQKRYFSKETYKMDDDTILVIEGIHGLNPKLLPDVDSKLIFRIYISALTQLNLDSETRISTTDNRILRRMIRDSRTRNTSASETLSRWPSVERGEKNHIFPYQNNADVMINSALDYELGVRAPQAIPLLKSVKKDEKDSYPMARRLLSFLDFVYPIDPMLVPSDSLVREFIGGSIYGAV